ncbi:MAG: pyridoxamine 5'-phosphate oxidase family protein [Bacteroidetes bacterium]|nr:pyridoxamine 5'-phosphate oxidase family protein [Bacteroidota bacterium]
MTVQELLNKCVLCWLATANKKGEPNVSTKELFLATNTDEIIIANIASPRSIRNISENPSVCISAINIWTQKGLQCIGQAKIISPQQIEFKEIEADFRPMCQGRFRIQHFIKVKVIHKKELLAPSYFFYPNTCEKDQIIAARSRYFNIKGEENG